MRIALPGLLLCLCSLQCLADLTRWDGQGLEAPVGAPNYGVNGTVSFIANVGMTSSARGSIFIQPGPGRYPTGREYEIRVGLRLQNSGGSYVIYLNGTADALLGDDSATSSGSFLALEFFDVQKTPQSCSMQYAVHKRKDGILTRNMWTGVTWCADLMAIHAVIRSNFFHVGAGSSDGGTVWRFPLLGGVTGGADNDLLTMPSYLAGVGVRNTPAGNGIKVVSFHNVDTTPPPTPALPAVSAYPGEIQMQWPGMQDDASGAGMHTYILYRRGTDGQMHEVQWLRDPSFIDRAVADELTAGPGPYEYQVQAIDFHYNASAPRTFTVSKAPAGSLNPRRVGVRPDGTYWGGAGEQIDVQSGNVNFSLPLLSVKTRTGVGVNFSLNYNSQQWRKDAQGTWAFGRDTGFGYGWQLLAGSLRPVYVGTWTVGYYIFIDSTGAEYLLDQCTAGICTSKELFVTYDQNTGRLRFNDGTWWQMGVESAVAEWDGGTLYPSLIQDTNGNQIELHYRTGAMTGYPESSSRIERVFDSRFQVIGASTIPTYTFYYSVGATGREYLMSISGVDVGYSFIYNGPFVVSPPWSANPALTPEQSAELYGKTMVLSYVTKLDSGKYTFYYQGYDVGATHVTSGELISAVLPYGAQIWWGYRDFTYQGNRTFREILTRHLSVPLSLPDNESAAPMADVHTFWRNDGTDAGLFRHIVVKIEDGAGQKVYYFDEQRHNTLYQERKLDDTSLRDTSNAWTVTPGSSVPYIWQSTVSMSGITVSQSEQTLDSYGNVLTSKKVDPATGRVRTATQEYLHTNSVNGSTYAAAYIRNRLQKVSITETGSTTTYVPFTAEYDSATILNDPPPPPPGSIYGPEALPYHDSATYTPAFKLRGNATQVCRSGVCTSVTDIDKLGMIRKSTGPNGVFDAVPTTYYWRYGTVAGSVKLNGVETTLSYDSAVRLIGTSGPDGSAVYGWDGNGRPTSKRAPDGSTVTITYTYPTNLPSNTPSPAAMVKEVSANRWTETYLDGLGRPVRVITGHGGVDLARPAQQPPAQTPRAVEAISDTRYGPCACTPFGKAFASSRPRTASSQPLVWNMTTYDALGRPLTITHPPMNGTAGSSGTSSYSYAVVSTQAGPRMQTTFTDAGQRWKKNSVDAFGDLREVYEPNPAGGTDYVATYAYNLLGQLATVTMTRPGNNGAMVTQTRTFDYYLDGSLQSTTFPETGKTSYTWWNGKKTSQKDDATNRMIAWEYNINTGRLVSVKRLGAPDSSGNRPEQSWRRVTYTYDWAGRVQTVAYGFDPAVPIQLNPNYSAVGAQIVETYGYGSGGHLTSKSMQTPWGTLSAQWRYDSVGRLKSITYPSGKVKNLLYGEDGRNTGLVDQPENESSTSSFFDPVTTETTGWVTSTAGAQYDAFGRMAVMTGAGNTHEEGKSWLQSWSYSESGLLTQYQLQEGTNLTYPLITTATYDYGSAPAAGKLASMTRTHQLGIAYPAEPSATTSYGYDSLGRLTSASSMTGQTANWSQSFVYDGFGNLVKKTGTGAAQYNTFDFVNTYFDSAHNGGVVASIDNQLLGPVGNETYERYFYDSSNRRVMRTRTNTLTLQNNGRQEFEAEITFWAGSQRMGYYKFRWDSNFERCCVMEAKEFFYIGGRAVRPMDRLGSNISNRREYLPYGEELSTSVNDTDKFGTYHRDLTGLDYADQRYYQPGYGRFTSPDPYQASGGAGAPGSWNRYAYVEGDPVNYGDPSGLNLEADPIRIGEGGWTGPFWDINFRDPESYGIPVFNMNPIQGFYSPPPGGGSTAPPCPPVPNLPGRSAREEVQKNIDEAHQAFTEMLYGAKDGGSDPTLALMGYFTAKFVPHGQWDYKRKYQENTIEYDLGKKFGNFNFGAVLQSFGFSLSLTQNAAGVAQVLICKTGGDCGKGTPFFSYPFGDQDEDQQDIIRGWEYQKMKRAGCK